MNNKSRDFIRPILLPTAWTIVTEASAYIVEKAEKMVDSKPNLQYLSKRLTLNHWEVKGFLIATLRCSPTCPEKKEWSIIHMTMFEPSSRSA